MCVRVCVREKWKKGNWEGKKGQTLGVSSAHVQVVLARGGRRVYARLREPRTARFGVEKFLMIRLGFRTSRAPLNLTLMLFISVRAASATVSRNFALNNIDQ